MKKRLNIFCILMLLLMATMVVMTFVTGADAFQEGWNAPPNKLQDSSSVSFIACM